MSENQEQKRQTTTGIYRGFLYGDEPDEIKRDVKERIRGYHFRLRLWIVAVLLFAIFVVVHEYFGI